MNYNLKVYAVIVTYSDRFNLLKQVIDSCLNENIDKIIVIDNNSTENSKIQLRNLEPKISDKLKVVYLEENIGSAGGYKRGLEEAYRDDDCEFIWLLDDDNKPQKNSLGILIDFWNKIEQRDKKEKISLLSYRKDRIVFKEAVMTDNPNLVLGSQNSFLGFHLLELPKKVIRVLKRKLGILLFKENLDIRTGLVPISPYGGIFFHKNLIDLIGLPNKDFFVYADDHDWSYRITKNSGSIYLVLDSEIDDIDTSWILKKKTTTPFYSYLNEGSDFRVYYTIRNRIYFEQNLVTSKFIYNLNKNIFLFILSFYKNTKNSARYEVFRDAVEDGINKKLGIKKRQLND